MKYIKEILIFGLIMIVMFWYVGISNVEIINDQNEHFLSDEELLEVHHNKILKNGVNFDIIYYTKFPVTYTRKRSLIPFVYKRDTIKIGEKTYHKWN